MSTGLSLLALAQSQTQLQVNDEERLRIAERTSRNTSTDFIADSCFV